MSSLLTEELAFLASVDPQSVAAAASVTTDVIDMRLFPHVVFGLQTGAFTDDATRVNVQVYVNSANSTSSPTPVAITGKTFANATFSHSLAGANAQGLIEVSGSEAAEALAGGRYVFATATVTGANAVLLNMFALGGKPRYEDASAYDLASVREIIS